MRLPEASEILAVKCHVCYGTNIIVSAHKMAQKEVK